jgi:hypothetical protein
MNTVEPANKLLMTINSRDHKELLIDAAELLLKSGLGLMYSSFRDMYSYS